jgi:ankyrin repeat protein
VTGAPSPILEALYSGDRERAETLAAEADALDVFEAAALGDAERLERILADNPDLAEEWSSDGFTALHYASFFGTPQTIEKLVAAGADLEAPARNEQFAPEARPLHSAAAAGRLDNAERLLEAGADPNARQHGGFTPLMEAEQSGNFELADLLIAHGAAAGGGA